MEKRIELTSELKKEYENWGRCGIINPHLLILQVDNGLSETCEFTIEYAKSLTKIAYENIGLDRPYDQCFLLLRYPRESEYERRLFFDSPSHIARFYRKFKGWQIIELSDWLKDVNSKGFMDLIYHLSERLKDTQFIFLASVKSEIEADDLFDRFNSIMRIKKLCFNMPAKKDLTTYAVDFLKSQGIHLEKKANTVLSEYIVTLSKQPSFTGYDSINRMMESIVYEFQMSNSQKTITANDLLLMESTRLYSKNYKIQSSNIGL